MSERVSEQSTQLAPVDLAQHLVGQVRDAIGYARTRRRAFRRSASAIKITSLGLSAASTIVLGLQDLNLWASLAFSLVALTTVLGAVEPFFNWRSRWVLMEEMQHRLHRIEDDLEYHLAKVPPGDLGYADLDEYYRRYQEAWENVGAGWIESRQREPS